MEIHFHLSIPAFFFFIHRVAVHFVHFQRCRTKIRSNNKFQWSFWRFFFPLNPSFFSRVLLSAPFFSAEVHARRCPFDDECTLCINMRVLLLLFAWSWLLFYDLLLFVYVECVFECHCPVVSIAEFNQKAIFSSLCVCFFVACISCVLFDAFVNGLNMNMSIEHALWNRKNHRKTANWKLKRIRFGNKFAILPSFGPKCGLESHRQMRQINMKEYEYELRKRKGPGPV